MARVEDVASWCVLFHPDAKNEARLSPCGLFVAMILTRGMATIIRERRWPEVRGCRWLTHRGSHAHYAYNCTRGKWRALHAVLLAKGCDHIDNDGLNNTCENLRLATPSQQMRNQRRKVSNTSGFVGVSPLCGKWRVQIRILGRKRYLGLFTTPEAAALAYDAALRELNTPFARYNFPRPGERGVHDDATELATQHTTEVTLCR